MAGNANGDVPHNIENLGHHLESLRVKEDDEEPVQLNGGPGHVGRAGPARVEHVPVGDGSAHVSADQLEATHVDGAEGDAPVRADDADGSAELPPSRIDPAHVEVVEPIRADINAERSARAQGRGRAPVLPLEDILASLFLNKQFVVLISFKSLARTHQARTG